MGGSFQPRDGEDLRHTVGPTLRTSDPEAKRAAREQLATGFLPTWASATERQLVDDGPFVGGAKLNVADLKLYMVVRWLATGSVEHVPATVFDAYPKLQRVYEAVGDDPGVKAWQAKTR